MDRQPKKKNLTFPTLVSSQFLPYKKRSTGTKSLRAKGKPPGARSITYETTILHPRPSDHHRIQAPQLPPRRAKRPQLASFRSSSAAPPLLSSRIPMGSKATLGAEPQRAEKLEKRNGNRDRDGKDVQVS